MMSRRRPDSPPDPDDLASIEARAAAFFLDLGLMLFLAFIFSVAYFIGMWAWRGQTIGQMLLGIKVVPAAAQRMNLRIASRRFVGYAACILTVGIGFLAAAFDANRQGLHDRIAKTYVVRADR